VVDECGDCDNEVGASAHIRRNFRLDPSLGEVSISFSDFNRNLVWYYGQRRYYFPACMMHGDYLLI
jgi:hypothetical protein